MAPPTLSNHQLVLINRPIENKIFLEGPAGTGKTTAGVGRLLHLLDSRVRARSILVLVPQRTLATPYYEALRRPTVRAGGQVTISTVGGLAQQAVDLFWPLIAEEAGFGQPDQAPTFLTLETAQYYMARLVRPLLEQGYFETVTINRNRLYSQILDNLNKAAVVGFPHTQIGERLKAAWGGEHSQKRIYDEAQACATRFRDYCLAHNLLDFSLQVEVFVNHLWNLPLCHDYLLTRYTHLIVDNVEEDTPVAHDLLSEWLPHCRSALLIYDREAGYRRFLGADPQNAYTLKQLCQEEVAFTGSSVSSPDLRAFGNQLARSFNRPSEAAEGDVRAVLAYEYHRYHPQMLDWVASEIAGLVHEQDVPPGEIVVLAPFLTDALRFSLMNRLERLGVPARSHRPSRALREEPATRCLLTLAAIAHPQWGICPGRFDVAYALMQSIDGMDLVRAQLLAEIVYRVKDNVPTLSSFGQISPDMQERITFVLGGRYEDLRAWIEGYIAGPMAPLPEVGRGPAEFDHFLSRLFGEVLSQAGYGFHCSYDAGEVAANLIESVQKFRWVTNVTSPLELGGIEGGHGGKRRNSSPGESKPLGQEYVEMVQDGVVAAQYIRSWQLQPQDAVLLSPAYTFLMSNRPVDYQFWLNAGSRGWWERLYQPLTHPYVLSRHWPSAESGRRTSRANAVWSDANEFETRQDALYRLTLGLIRRCRRKIYLGLSELGEQGYEQQGPLLQAIQRVLRRLPAEPEVADV
ncbi:MAG: hypothetical protein ISS50_02395 [Anaerolineae bacterium]|nr:hypothetical protein [Anaerolineae bacterium]